MNDLLENISSLHPQVKIILNETTPRNDDRDDQVIECNKALLNIAKTKGGIFLAEQGNLRDRTYSFHHDNKHIKQGKIARYASNLKIAMRRAYGMEDPRYSNYRNHQNQQRNDRNNQRDNLPSRSNAQHYQNTGERQNPSINNTQSNNERIRMRKEIEQEFKTELKNKLLTLFG